MFGSFGYEIFCVEKLNLFWRLESFVSSISSISSSIFWMSNCFENYDELLLSGAGLPVSLKVCSKLCTIGSCIGLNLLSYFVSSFFTYLDSSFIKSFVEYETPRSYWPWLLFSLVQSGLRLTGRFLLVSESESLMSLLEMAPILSRTLRSYGLLALLSTR